MSYNFNNGMPSGNISSSFATGPSGPLGSGTYGLNQDYLGIGNYGNVAPQSQASAFEFKMPVPQANMSFDASIGNAPVAPEPGSDFWSMKSMLGGKNADGSVDMGWGGMALGAAQGLGNAYMAMKQYGLAKQTLAENKRQFQLNYDAQKSTTNSALEDRQRARVASNAGAYQSVGDYMNKNGIK